MPAADMEPLLPDVETLRRSATAVIRSADDLGKHLHPATIRAVTELLRTINCYYSNLIEGHDTHPINIERALHDDYSNDPRSRNLQIEAKAHIDVQRAIELRLDEAPESNVCSPSFVRWIHGEFYSRLPGEMRLVRHPTGNRTEEVIPGALREFDVRVGRHIAPSPHELEGLLERFAEVYNPAAYALPSRNLGAVATDRTSRTATSPRADEEIDRARALATLGAAHHRLLWIHPFGDGNGRVTRLMTDAYLRRVETGGHGLWTVSRGLARQRARYLETLANADSPRWNDLDGRGARSARALNEFCAFFLDVCNDQVDYMTRMLGVERLFDRFTQYCRNREAGLLAPPSPAGSDRRWGMSGKGTRAGRPSVGFRPEATLLLRALLGQGPLPRSEVPELTRLGERTARRLVNDLTAEGFLGAPTHRAPIELRFPAHAAPYVFPELYSPATSETE